MTSAAVNAVENRMDSCNPCDCQCSMTQMSGKDALHRPVLGDCAPGDRVALFFEQPGKLGGTGGCNGYGADYQVEGNTLAVGAVVSTLMACADEAVNQQEQQYFRAIQAAGEYQLSALVRYWKGMRLVEEPARAGDATQEPMWDDMEPAPLPEDGDELLPKAVAIVQENKRASISMLQRRLRIGYSRAARLIDEMEKKGLIGPEQEGNRTREVLDTGTGAPSRRAEPDTGLDQDDEDLPPL
jgi:DNA segregation ATPase FtsK/SpoIIIE-like protein